MQFQLNFRQTLVFRALIYLAFCILLLAALSIGTVYFHQRAQLETKVLEAGYGFLDSYVNETRDSIAKGQTRTFQDVTDNVVRIDELIEVASYASSGLMTYLSGQVTVGKPFVHNEETGELENPNLELYQQTHGRYQRPDWNLRDHQETNKAREHIAKKETEGKACADCHFVVPEDLAIEAGSSAHRLRGSEADFYFALRADGACIACHTNWQEGATAGYLRVTMDASSISAQSREAVWNNVAVLAAVIVPAAIAIVLVFYLMLYRPIRALVENIDGLTKGEGDLTRRLDDQAKSEMGLLSRLFNSFIAKIHDIVASIKQHMTAVHDSASDLHNQSARITQSNGKMADQLANVTRQAKQVQGAAAEVTSAIDTISGSFDGVRQVIEQTRVSALDNRTSTQQASGSVDEFFVTMTKLQNHSNEVVGQLQQIDSIADQTNLLALNAAIEAARAGEHGRGFAVVAEEVRALAIQTAQLTRSIKEILGSFTGNMDHARTVMDAIRGRMEGVSHSSTATEQELAQASGQIETLAGEVETVSSAVQQQTELTETIVTTIFDASNEAESTLRIAEHLNQLADDLMGSVQSVQTETSKFRTKAEGGGLPA